MEEALDIDAVIMATLTGSLTWQRIGRETYKATSNICALEICRTKRGEINLARFDNELGFATVLAEIVGKELSLQYLYAIIAKRVFASPSMDAS